MKQHEIAPFALADAPDENPNPVLLISHEGILIYANTASAPLQKCWNIDIGEKVPTEFLKPTFAFIAEGAKGSFEILCDGRFYAFRVSIPQGQDHISLYGNDITEDKINWENLRSSEKQFRQIADGVAQFLWTALPDGTIDYCNSRVCEYEGIEQRLGGAWDWIAMVHPDDISQTLLAWNEAFQSGGIYEIEHRLRKKDGQWRWHLCRAVPLKDEQGRIVKWLGSTTDIDDQKRVEEILRQSEERLRLAMEAGYLGAVEYDLASGDVMGDDVAQRISGLITDRIQFTKAIQIFHPEDAVVLEKAILEAVDPAIAKPIDLELRIVRGRRRKTWMALKAKPHFEGEGPNRRAVRIMATSMDITERKNTEEALRQSEERLRMAMEAGELGIWVFDLATKQVSNDKVTRSIANIIKENMASEEAFQRVHPEDRKMAYEVMREATDPFNAKPVDVECRIMQPDGTFRWVAVNGQTYFDGEGSDRHAVKLAGTVKDITQRKLAEQALREREEQYRQFYELGVIGAAEADPGTGRLLRVNKRYCEITGYDSEEILSMTVREITHPEDREADWDKFRQMLSGETPQYNNEKRYIRKDGRVIWVHVVARAIRDATDKPLRTVAIIIDITERKKAEDALRESEGKFRTLAENAPVVVGIVQGTHFLYVNPFMEKLSGYTQEELLTLDIRKFLHPDSLQLVVDRAIRRQRGEAVPSDYEFLMVTKSGEARWIHLSSSAILYQGEPALVGAGIDVTDLKRSEGNLTESRHRLQLAAEVAQIGTMHWDIRKNQMTWDANCAKILGAGPEGEISYSHLEGVLHPDDREQYEKAVTESIERHEEYQLEFRITPKDGTTRWIFSKGQPFYTKDNQPAEMIVVFMDISGRKEREHQLASIAADLERSNKDLEHFAYIASHDLQEPLRTLRGFLQLLEKRYKDSLDAAAREYIEYAVTGAARMHDLIQDLLSYSRVMSAAKPMEIISMEEVFGEVKASLQLAISESGAEVTHDPLPVVRADPAQMRQLLQNFLSNAIKFRKPHEPPQIHLGIKRQDGKWLFGVQDNGIGIDQKYYEKIFTIFQRLHTSDKYSGTGIGLAVCKRIIERHGGQIWLESKPGEGSTFFFTLPRI